MCIGLLYLDGNDLQGDLDSACNQLTVPVMVADCGGDEPQIFCGCCIKCCSVDQECNDDKLVPSNDPMWQFGYDRPSFVFGNLTDFFIAFP